VQGQEIFLFSKTSRPALGTTQPPVGNGASFSGLKWPGREVDHSPPPGAEVKNEWSCTFDLPICLHGVDRENFFTFILCLNGVNIDRISEFDSVLIERNLVRRWNTNVVISHYYHRAFF
jgi:hypothetical protein